MYLDPTNPPFNLATPPGVGGPGGSAAANPPTGGAVVGTLPVEPAGMPPNDTLTIENVLLAEFNYASTTAYQAMEDRARMFDRYLLIISGVFVTGVGAIKQLNDSGFASYTHAVALVFLAAAVGVGTAFFLSLANLRRAWQRSAICMSVIKEFYISRFGNDLRKAFFWRAFTLPKLERFTSVTGTVCLTVLCLNSLCVLLFFLAATQVILFGSDSSFAQLSDTPAAPIAPAHGQLPGIFGLPQVVFYIILYGPALILCAGAVFVHLGYIRRTLRNGLKKDLEDAKSVFDGSRQEKDWVTGAILTPATAETGR